MAERAKKRLVSAETGNDGFARFVPAAIDLDSATDHQKMLPSIARDEALYRSIEAVLPEIPTRQDIYLGDSRKMDFLKPESVHLVVTSPPYWTLKQYNKSSDQLGEIEDYEEFLLQLDHVWEHCFRALAPGGRLVCVVGDVCVSRRNNNGRHYVMPLHASIQEHCRRIGFDNLSPIIWHKISNANYEVSGGGGFLGKPYEPNAVIKNDIEFILMQRKPGGYRKPSLPVRVLSVIPDFQHKKWFQQIWSGVTGASTKNHPAPYPVELAERLIRMFSFVGDIVLDPFLGSGTTIVAASKNGRNGIGVEVDKKYFLMSIKRIVKEISGLFNGAEVFCHEKTTNE